MALLYPSQRSLPAYRQSLIVDDDEWITSRVPLYYLDLAIPNETLFEEIFKKVFPYKVKETGGVAEFYFTRRPRFHLDDTTIGCRSSNLSFYASSTVPQVDYIELDMFLEFMRRLEPWTGRLRYGESAVRFINMTTLIGYEQWGEEIFSNPRWPSHQRLADFTFGCIYPTILRGVYKMKSEHPLLVKKLWDVFCQTEDTQRKLFLNVPDAEHLRFMLEVANETKFDFWGMRIGSKKFRTEYTFLDYVRQHRFDLVAVMLEFGFTLDTTYYHYSWLETDLHHNVSMVLFLLKCYDMCNCKNKLQEFTELFKKLFRTHPLPSLPLRVVQRVARAFHRFPTEELLQQLTAIYEICNYGMVVSSDRSDVATPQRLVHLSRCVLRKRLAADYRLPTAIDDSRLPTSLKRFLKADC